MYYVRGNGAYTLYKALYAYLAGSP